MKNRSLPCRPILVPGFLAAAFLTPSVPAQDDRPAAAQPASRAVDSEDVFDGLTPNGAATMPAGRREAVDHPVTFGFKDRLVEEYFGFIAETTGKVIIPINLQSLKQKKITILNDEEMPLSLALDKLFEAFRLNEVGLIELDDVIVIGPLEQVVAFKIPPVLAPDDDVMLRQDRASIVLKLFQLTEARAEDVAEIIGEGLPPHATLTADPNSNRIVVQGDIALCQYLQTLINELDHTYIQARTETFRLAHADASEIAENIIDLFEVDEAGRAQAGQGGGRQAGARNTQRRGQQAQAAPPGVSQIGPQIELRVTVNAPQNSVTVTAEPAVVEEIGKLIASEWDLPRAPGTSKIYQLVYTDPIKVADKLNALLGQGGSGTGSRRTGGNRGARGGGGATAGAGGGTGVDQVLSGIYKIEPYPDTNQLLVFCKTEEAIGFLDQFITTLDQPTTIGMPFVVELKHANAVELSAEINALLAPPGAGVTLDKPQEGLTGRTEGEAIQGDQGGEAAGTIDFPWQRSGSTGDEQAPETALIGRVRIVPIVRQNALAVLCPAPHRESVRELIHYFDRAGRQVELSAVICEVELTDELALGLRYSSGDSLSTSSDDYALFGGGTFAGTKDTSFFGLFDTATLDVNMSVNVVLQTLSQLTNVKIIQQPKVFTADNQEAIFFDGQDIPFITTSTINSQGNPTDSFEYKEVGVTLNARPRITSQGDVDLEILLVLSSIVPGQTLFGGAIVDRRETRTNLVVKNEQTVVISGILREDETKITRKVPLIGDLPIIGALFTNIENTTRQAELIAFITPRVVVSPEENDVNFQLEYRRRLEELSQPLDEQLRAVPGAMKDRISLPNARPGSRMPVEAEPSELEPVSVDDLNSGR